MKKLTGSFAVLIALSFILAIVLFTTVAQSNTGEPSGKQPRIEVNTESHDFGKITDGDIVEHTFMFRNAGDDTLKIYDVRASCGCTAVLLSEKVIPPGGKGEIKATFNSRGKTGHVEKTIYVNSNDPKKGTVFLKLIADIQPPAHPEKVHEMQMTGNYFEGKCANCHVEPGHGKTGAALFEAVCSMCHGENATGGVAQLDLRDKAPKMTAAYLTDRISRGSPSNIMMRGFAVKEGGHLSDTQIESLVMYLKGLQP